MKKKQWSKISCYCPFKARGGWAGRAVDPRTVGKDAVRQKATGWLGREGSGSENSGIGCNETVRHKMLGREGSGSQNSGIG